MIPKHLLLQEIYDREMLEFTNSLDDKTVEEIAKRYCYVENSFGYELNGNFEILKNWTDWALDGQITTEEEATTIKNAPTLFLKHIRSHHVWLKTDREIMMNKILEGMDLLDITFEELELKQMHNIMGV